MRGINIEEFKLRQAAADGRGPMCLQTHLQKKGALLEAKVSLAIQKTFREGPKRISRIDFKNL